MTDSEYHAYYNKAQFLERTMLNLAELFPETNPEGHFDNGYAKGIKLMSDAIKHRVEMVREFYPVQEDGATV